MPNGVKPTALRRAGRIDNAVPDADVPTGRMSAKLDDMPGPRRQRTTEQFDRLDSDGREYLGNTDIDDPALKAADLFENTGPQGHRALDDLADGDREAADVLLQMDDAATQWRFARAYDSDSVDSDELAMALKRYDELDPNEKRTADEMVARGGDDGVSLLDEQVCNSPCDSFTEAWHGLKQTDSVSSNDATIFRNNLLGGIQRGEISDGRAADLLGDTKQLATDEGRDVTDVINRDDRFSRALIRQYDESDSVGTDTLRRMDQVGEIDLPNNQVRDKYKHADDFGVTGNKNSDNIESFKEAIAEHTADPDTRRISGTYRGDPVTHLYNSRTDNNIIVRPNGEFLSGWELSQSQKQSVTSSGELS